MSKDGKGIGDGAKDDGSRKPTKEEREKWDRDNKEYWDGPTD